MANQQGEAGTREKIIAAGVQMLGEDTSAKLSVRAVAARAGVSTGSLRHFFPTQRELLDTVLTNIYDLVVSDDAIQDRSRPARERLVDCLRQVLAPGGVGAQSRENMSKIYETFIAPETTEDLRSLHGGMAREGQRRVEHWLAVLTTEGVLAPGDNAARARFLNTVLNGLAFERAMPNDESILETETQTLQFAVDSVLGSSS